MMDQSKTAQICTIGISHGNQTRVLLKQMNAMPATKAHPAIRVLDMVALRSRLQARNIDIIEDDSSIGVERFYLHDPFGNRLEFVEAQLLPAP